MEAHEDERFTLFPEASTEEKKTKTQREIEERESWVKSVSLSSSNSAQPWYLQNKTTREETLEETPIERKKSSKSKTIEDLRQERLLRERREREKVESLLNKRRRL